MSPYIKLLQSIEKSNLKNYHTKEEKIHFVNTVYRKKKKRCE